MSLQSASKYMRLIVRHKPELIGIVFDERGWTNEDELIAGINQTQTLTMETLEQISWGNRDKLEALGQRIYACKNIISAKGKDVFDIVI